MNPLVGIILVNYNGYDDTVECIKSLKQITYDNYRIIVVDNGSNVRNKDAIAYIKSNSIYMESKDNLGFSGGNNIGLKYAIENGCEYILLLNNDTTVEPHFLTCLVNTAEANSDVGIVCGKIMYYDEKNRIWFAGGTFNWDTGYANHEHFNEIEDESFCQEEKEIQFATGCLWLLHKDIVKRVGSMDENYFLYAEDTDYCCRIIKEGLKIIYNPESVIYHKVSKSSNNSDNIVYYMVRNSLYIVKKYAKKPIKAYVFYFQLFAKNVIRGEKRVSTVIEAWSDFRNNIMGKRNSKHIER